MTLEQVRARVSGKELRGVLHLPYRPRPPCVVVSHGLFSAKESPKIVRVAERLAQSGFAALRYDHLGCGESDGDIGETTVSSRIRELGAMVDVAAHHPLLGPGLGLLGSSLGGFISIFKAAADPRVGPVCLWATPAFLRGVDRRAEEGFERLEERFFSDAARYDAREAITQLAGCLILHGEADELVPVAHARALWQAAPEPKALQLFPGGDHRFTDEEDRERAIELSVGWFVAHFRAP
ncbi:MAG: alpha/beta fold hydrolase [Deltaproteobacteria bacterium]|nr:alpha/beta fold hydrolase [Deltaproteobacteria bacterium]